MRWRSRWKHGGAVNDGHPTIGCLVRRWWVVWRCQVLGLAGRWAVQGRRRPVEGWPEHLRPLEPPVVQQVKDVHAVQQLVQDGHQGVLAGGGGKEEQEREQVEKGGREGGVHPVLCTCVTASMDWRSPGLCRALTLRGARPMLRAPSWESIISWFLAYMSFCLSKSIEFLS